MYRAHEIVELISESHHLCDRREGGRSDNWNIASARVHSFKSFFLAGRSWDHLEMEIVVPGATERTFGTCLWIGRRFEEILLKGRPCNFRTRNAGLLEGEQPICRHSPVSHDRRDNEHRSSICRKELFPGFGYHTKQFSSLDPPTIATISEAMATLSLEEAYVPESPPGDVCGR